MDGEHGYKAGELNQFHGRRPVCTVQANCRILPAQIRSVRLVETLSRRKDKFSFLGAADGIEFGGLRITSLLFADHVVSLAPSGEPLQLVLGQFAAKCEEGRISTSKTEDMVLLVCSVWSQNFQVPNWNFRLEQPFKSDFPVEATPPAPI